MKAYHYDELGFYDKEIPCQIDKLETEKAGHEVYLTPMNCTLKKPTTKDGYTPRWNGNAWEQYADDKQVYGYTENDDGTINYYGSAHTEEELIARVKDIELLFNDTEPVSVDGVYWLSADDTAYIEAKKAHDKAKALADLDRDYSSQKQELVNQYTDDILHEDTESAEADKVAMAELDAWYDEEYEKIVGEE